MLRIVWIEDEPHTVQGFREELEDRLHGLEEEFKIHTARTKEEALDLLGHEHCHLLFLDPMLPDDSDNGTASVINRLAGRQILEWIHDKGGKEERKYRIVVFTGMVNPRRIAEIQTYLVSSDVFIEKTATIDEFMENISDAIQHALEAAHGE